MTIKPVLILVFSILILASCQSKKDGLSKLWLYTHSSGATLNQDNLFLPSGFLLLQRNGAYTKDFGTFEYGNWDLDKDKFRLTNQFDKTTILAPEFTGLSEMRLPLGQGVFANFEGFRLPPITASENPFSKENNLWRLPAKGKETRQELKQRLSNHCGFWEAYFSWALKNELTTVDVRSTPTLIKIYGNGFALKPFAELPAKWKSYFYDEEDCEKANELMKQIFETTDIAWSHTDHKYKMFISAFQQLRQQLK